jgi:vesicle coat complex subunit
LSPCVLSLLSADTSSKYNDPIYVKLEKLEIIIKLVSERNIEQVLLELKEYSTEVDVDFVRRAVSAIGRCAVKLERAAERCIGVLLELIQTKVNYGTCDRTTRVKGNMFDGLMTILSLGASVVGSYTQWSRSASSSSRTSSVGTPGGTSRSFRSCARTWTRSTSPSPRPA